MSSLSPAHQALLSIALSLATFLIVLDYSIANVSIPYIAGDLAVSNQQGTYVITSFAVGNAVGLPITGWLTKRIGSIRLITGSLLLFVLFSWFCGIAWSYEVLVVSRCLQGFVSGPLIPLSQSLIISHNPPEKKNSIIALWSAVVVAAPILGPLLGGWLSYDYKWPWIFFINIPVGLVSAYVIWTLLKNHDEPKIKEPLDRWGVILLFFFVACLQIFLDTGEQYDWFKSTGMRTLIITSIIAFIFLIGNSLTLKKPLLELSLFRIRSYALSVFFMGIAYSIYFGSVVLIPLWLQENMGYTPIWAGVAVCPIGIAPLCAATLPGKMVSRIGSIIPLAICFILFAASCFYTAYFDTDVSLPIIGFSRFLLGCALVFFITPLFALSVRDLSLEQLPSGTGMFHFVRAMMGGVGTAVFTTLWIRRSAYHHLVLGENTTPYSQSTKMWFSQLEQMGFEGSRSLEMTNQALDHQATMLALNDCFYLMGWIFLGLLLILPFARKKKQLLGDVKTRVHAQDSLS